MHQVPMQGKSDLLKRAGCFPFPSPVLQCLERRKGNFPHSLAPLTAGSAVSSLSGRHSGGGRVEGPLICALGV
jgi:hypothetical protein